MNLKRLFLLHASITFAAGVVLALFPELIPQTVGIRLDPQIYLLSYFLSGAEFAIAFLSYRATKLTDTAAIRIIVQTCIVFHGMTALLEGYALVQGGVDQQIWFNIALRIVAVLLFTYYGLRKKAYV